MSQRCRGATMLVWGLLTCLLLSCTNAPMEVAKDQGEAPSPISGCLGGAYEKLPSGARGSAIPGVCITFVGELDQIPRTVSTDVKGMYRVALPHGRYRVVAQHPDYDSSSATPKFLLVTGRGFQTCHILLIRALATTILLVRHAEKAGSSGDPPLTPAGQARAQELVHVAQKAGVKAIYATGTQRSQQTVQPLATGLQLPITTYAYQDVAGLKNSILSNHRGKVVVVAGHTDTLEPIASAFGADPSTCRLTTDEFDNLWVLTVFGSGKAGCINLQYGATSP